MLSCVVVCCSVLSCVAVCCSVLQCVAVCCSVLQCMCCSVLLQWIAACFRVLQCVAVCTAFSWDPHSCMRSYFAACCSVLQRVAACCNVLQRVAACCNVLQHVAVFAVCCIVSCDPQPCMLINTCDMTPVYFQMTNLYVQHDSFMYATWLIYLCDMTNLYMRNDWIICTIWLIYVFDKPQSFMYMACLNHVSNKFGLILFWWNTILTFYYKCVWPQCNFSILGRIPKSHSCPWKISPDYLEICKVRTSWEGMD